MGNMLNSASTYRRTQVETAPAGQLVVLLYDGAVKFLDKALDHFGSKKLDVINENILKTQNILTELMLSLDLDGPSDPVFTRRLYGLYDYMHRRLVEANLKKDPEPVREVRRYLDDLRGAWSQASAKASVPDYPGDVPRGGVNLAS